MSEDSIDAVIRDILASSAFLGETSFVYAQPEQIGLHNFDPNAVYLSVNMMDVHSPKGGCQPEELAIELDAFSCFRAESRRGKTPKLWRRIIFYGLFVFPIDGFDAGEAAFEISEAYKAKTGAVMDKSGLVENLQAAYDILSGKF